eukprot:COSAG02_NODE_9_length_59728_cov_36.104714_51_plen_105_part_00
MCNIAYPASHLRCTRCVRGCVRVSRVCLGAGTIARDSVPVDIYSAGRLAAHRVYSIYRIPIARIDHFLLVNHRYSHAYCMPAVARGAGRRRGDRDDRARMRTGI